MDYIIKHYPERRHFEITLEGYVGYLKYILNEDSMDIISTIVPKAIEGKGVASALVKTAYEYAIENGLYVIPTCSYVEVWLKRHPEYRKN